MLLNMAPSKYIHLLLQKEVRNITAIHSDEPDKCLGDPEVKQKRDKTEFCKNKKSCSRIFCWKNDNRLAAPCYMIKNLYGFVVVFHPSYMPRSCQGTVRGDHSNMWCTVQIVHRYLLCYILLLCPVSYLSVSSWVFCSQNIICFRHNSATDWGAWSEVSRFEFRVVLISFVPVLLIQGVHKRMVQFQKLTRHLFLTLHGHNVHRQQRLLSKFLMRDQQLVSRGQFPRWRRSRKRLSVCSVLRCPDLWLQCSVSW
jgi:hypothetical protein